MEHQVIGANLVRIRKHRRKTQVEVAEASGLSRAAYRSVEKGRSLPRTENLRAIARALGVPVRELVTPVPRLQHVRFRSLKKLKSRDQIVVEVARWLKDFGELEELLGERGSHDLEGLWGKLASADENRPQVAADLARAHFGLAPQQPVHDVCGLLEAHGVKVHAVEVASDAFLGLSVAPEDGGPAVVVNSWPRLAVEHWIYSAVHELGHLLLHRPAYDIDVEAEDDEQEKEAEAFASHFLMPEAAFQQEWREARGLPLLERVIRVKRIFRVSWRVVVYRVCESLSPEQRKRVWARIAWEYRERTGRPLHKLTEPAGIPTEVFGAPRIIARSASEVASLDALDFERERLAWLVRRAFEEGEISLSRAAEVLGIHLDDMRERAQSWAEAGVDGCCSSSMPMS